MFFDEIQRGLKFDEYHSVEEIKSDLLYMMDSVIVYYEGRDKDVLSRFIDYCKNLLGDCWFYYRVEDEDGFEQFLRRNQRRLKNVFWKDEVVEEIFRVFRQDCKDYPILLPRTLRKLLPPKTPTISVSPKVRARRRKWRFRTRRCRSLTRRWMRRCRRFWTWSRTRSTEPATTGSSTATCTRC